MVGRVNSGVRFARNTFLLSGITVLPDSIEDFQSDNNLFIRPAKWDYDVGTVSTSSLAETQQKLGLELQSIAILDPLMAAGLRAALYSAVGCRRVRGV